MWNFIPSGFESEIVSMSIEIYQEQLFDNLIRTLSEETKKQITSFHEIMMSNGYVFIPSKMIYLHRNGFEYNLENEKHLRSIVSHINAGTTPPPF